MNHDISDNMDLDQCIRASTHSLNWDDDTLGKRETCRAISRNEMGRGIGAVSELPS